MRKEGVRRCVGQSGFGLGEGSLRMANITIDGTISATSLRANIRGWSIT
jgi:hypothetical protein